MVKNFIECCKEMPTVTKIRWELHACDVHPNLKVGIVPPFYRHNKRAKKSQWDLWTAATKLLVNHKIDEVLDVGTGNAYFPYMLNIQGINAWGVEPRAEWVDKHNPLFQEAFGQEKLIKGGVEEFVKHFNVRDNEHIHCVTFMNLIHLSGWHTGETYDVLDLATKAASYIICSKPKDAKALAMLQDRTKVIRTFRDPVNHQLRRCV